MSAMETMVLLHWLYAGVLFVVGLVVGSFLNVVIYRAPLGMSIVSPPSSCPACGKRIAARDNVPLFGWLLLGGKCRSCGAPISPRYPLVELATGLLWALAGWRLAGMDAGFVVNVATGLLLLAFVSAMVVTFLVDWDHRIILDEISLGGLGVALVASILLPGLHHAAAAADFAAHSPVLDHLLGDSPAWLRGLSSSLVGAAFGLGFSLLITVVGNQAFRKQIAQAQRYDPEIDSALGMGDVKLMTFFGAFLGWKGVLFIFIAGSCLGVLAGGVRKYRSGDAGGERGWRGMRARWRSGDSGIPFGPFLATGAVIYLFWGDPIMNWVKYVFSPLIPPGA